MQSITGFMATAQTFTLKALLHQIQVTMDEDWIQDTNQLVLVDVQ
jgi:hypothetical protein